MINKIIKERRLSMNAAQPFKFIYGLDLYLIKKSLESAGIVITMLFFRGLIHAWANKHKTTC
jgi:hypothetical protein